jgi:hypothetical protein
MMNYDFAICLIKSTRQTIGHMVNYEFLVVTVEVN